MRKASLFFNVIVAFSLVMMLLGSTSIPARADNDKELKADPALLQLADEHPDDRFLVIIQRDVKNKDLKDDDPETALEKEGGRVKKQLQMIESFSAELTGKKIEKLAKNPKVRWISFDALYAFEQCRRGNGICRSDSPSMARRIVKCDPSRPTETATKWWAASCW